jgi:hypothetical protein
MSKREKERKLFEWIEKAQEGKERNSGREEEKAEERRS